MPPIGYVHLIEGIRSVVDLNQRSSPASKSTALTPPVTPADQATGFSDQNSANDISPTIATM